MNPLAAENVNYLWAQLLFAEWRRLGVAHVVICPGSRSSPLAVAAARDGELRVTVVLDERCAGFIALGVAKASDSPAVVITTSGTAVANLLPAAVEASVSGTPLLLVTADRPPELRECGANQSIDQRDILGRFARWSFELPAPSVDIDPTFVVSTANEAFCRATAWPPGPVHINAPFREPLAPASGPMPIIGDRLQKWMESGAPWRRELVQSFWEPGNWPQRLEERRILVVAGMGGTDMVRHAMNEDIPCIADVTAMASGRNEHWTFLSPYTTSSEDVHLPATNSIPAADVILAALADDQLTGLLERLRPEVVVRAGGPISSKRVTEFLTRAPRLIVERHIARQDEKHAATDVGTIRALSFDVDPDYLTLWRRVSSVASLAIHQAISEGDQLTEPWIARNTALRMRPGPLVVGSSMPVRDLDMFWPGDAARATRVLANRGASGIDGTISTAVGVASALQAPTTVLLGDLATLHDLGGLANVRSAGTPLDIITINNDGGAIFHFLPISREPAATPHFERLFGTPHGLSFEHAAAMFGLGYRRATTRDEFASALAGDGRTSGSRLIECVTDRSRNVEVHRAIQRAVAHALVKEFA